MLDLLAAHGAAYEAVEAAIGRQRGATDVNLAWGLSCIEHRVLSAMPAHDSERRQRLGEDLEDYRTALAQSFAVARQAAYMIGIRVRQRGADLPTADGGAR